MLRRHLAHAIVSANPAEGSLRPYLLALLAIMAVPNVSFACAMYIPLEQEQLVAEAPSLDVVFADIDAAVAEVEAPAEAAQGIAPEAMELLLAAEPQAVPAPEPTADAEPQS